MKNSFLRFLDLLFLMRPVLLVPVWGFSLFGYYRARCFDIRQIQSLWNSTSISTCLILCFFSISVGTVYILNQIADIEVDKKNGGLPLIASGIVSRNQALNFSIVIFLLSLLPILLLNRAVAFLSVLTLIIGLLYSFKPFYFSGKPFLDFTSNAVGYGIIAFGAGWVCGGKSLTDNNFLFFALPYFLLMCAGSISSTLPDHDGDASVGKNTTAVLLGIKNAHLLATLLLLSAVILAIKQHDIFTLICTTVPMPFYWAYLIKPSVTLMEATYKVGGAIIMICAGLIFPWMIAAGIIVFFLTRLYFRIRHGVLYPSLVTVRNDQ